MQPQIIEGTWDEIDARLAGLSDELRGAGRLRLMVFPEVAAEPDYDSALGRLFEAADLLEATAGGPAATRRKARVRKQVVEKFRRQGLMK